MTQTRRAFTTAIIAGTAAGFTPASSAFPKLFGKDKPPPIQGPYGPASAYSAERRGVSMLVMQAGQVVFEHYPEGGARDFGWELASGTKSFTSIMAAAASADGFLSIDELCADTLPEWKRDFFRGRITIRHLLSLTAGLAMSGPTAQPPSYADAILAKADHVPGAEFEYGPTPFQIFGEIMRRKLKKAGKPEDPVVWLQQRVLDRIGVQPNGWRRGTDGNPLLPQGAQFTAYNWAKFGQWVMDGADGVDPKVTRAMFEGSSANPGYGLSWWLLRPGLIGPSPRAGVDEASIGEAAMKMDIVMAAGAGDQRCYLIRSRKLVVVRQANRILQSFAPMAKKFRDGEFLELLPA